MNTKKKQVAYISGAITNNPNYKQQFDRAEAKLIKEYEVVYSPASCNKNKIYTKAVKDNPSKLWELCMRNCIQHLMESHVIVMLPGWEQSKGANLEHNLAIQLGMERVYVAEWWLDSN